MPEIDLEPREVRERYDVKPMSKWYLVIAAAHIALQAYVNGFSKWESWALAFAGFIMGFALILVFPRHFLRRRDD